MDRWPTGDRIRSRKTFRKRIDLRTRQPLDAPEKCHLLIQTASCILEPVPMHVGAVDAQRRADGIPEFVRRQLILARKYLNPVHLLEDALDRDIQPERQTIYIDTAELRRQRFLAQNPKVSAAPRHLDQRRSASRHWSLQRISRE
ncbi:MAG: hypothetical protein WBQ79_18785 [Acidobacteriaceae bacterium]